MYTLHWMHIESEPKCVTGYHRQPFWIVIALLNKRDKAYWIAIGSKNQAQPGFHSDIMMKTKNHSRYSPIKILFEAISKHGCSLWIVSLSSDKACTISMTFCWLNQVFFSAIDMIKYTNIYQIQERKRHAGQKRCASSCADCARVGLC